MHDARFEVPPGARAWLIVFHCRSTWWVERLVPGKWKHVSVIGFIPEANAWVALSWELARLRVAVVPDADFFRWLPGWCGPDAGMLRMAAPVFDIGAWRPRLAFFCTSIPLHVLGIRRGALLPGKLWRVLLAEGAEIASRGEPIPAQAGSLDATVGDGAGRPAVGGA